VRRFCIVRHGQSDWNAEKRWQGWIDVPLNEIGIAQAEARGAQLAAAGAAAPAIFTSDLLRARRTAELLAAALDAQVVPDQDLRERNGGEWQGHTATEIAEKWPGMLERWGAREILAPPGGENDKEVLARFDAAFDRLVAATPADADAIAVTHGGMLHLVAQRAGVTHRDVMANVGGLWFRYEGGELVADDILPAIVHDGQMKVE
jgi:probable phosphoglycerate mutase